MTYTADHLNKLNIQAQHQNHELETEYSTKYSKYLYQLERNRTANFYVYWSNALYILCSIVFIIAIFRGSRSGTISLTFKMTLILAIIVFPYYIVTFELLCKKWFLYAADICFGVPHTPSQWKIMGETKMMSK
jgi:hypothetical protein